MIRTFIFLAHPWYRICWWAVKFAIGRRELVTTFFSLRHFFGAIVESLLRSHSEKSFRILIKSNRNQIVFTIFLLISNQTDVRLVLNLSENGKYNLISVWFNTISLCVGSNWGPVWSPTNHHSTIVLSVLRGVLICPPLCRDMLVSRTTDVTFF